MSQVVIRLMPVRQAAADRDLIGHRELERARRRRRPWPAITAQALTLRTIGEVVGVDPRVVELRRRCPVCGRDDHGRPEVVGHRGIHVSVSYDDRWAIVAVTRVAPVGIDVQAAEATGFAGFDAVALAADERTAFEGRALDGGAVHHAGAGAPDRMTVGRARARVWARKEALLKATGHGLTVDPTMVVVSGPTEPPRLVAWRAGPAPPRTVSMCDLLLPGPTHAAALAVLATGPLDLDLPPQLTAVTG